jgi:hypothetical protein
VTDAIKVTAVDGVLVMRRGNRTATISEKGPARVVTLSDARNRGGAETVDDQARGDAFSAAVAAAAIAAFFD